MKEPAFAQLQRDIIALVCKMDLEQLQKLNAFLSESKTAPDKSDERRSAAQALHRTSHSIK